MPRTKHYQWITPQLNDANNVPLDLTSLATQIDSTLKEIEGELPGSSPTISATLRSGLSGSITLRKLSPVMAEVRISISGSIPAGDSELGTLPAELRPVGSSSPRIAARVSGPVGTAVVYVDASGLIGVTTTATHGALQSRGLFPIV